MTTTSTQFAAVPRSVIELGPEIGSLAVHVYVVLADHANADFECWPSKSYISKSTGISMRSVRDQLLKLERHGVISIENRTAGQAPASNLYRLLSPYQPPKRSSLQGSANAAWGGAGNDLGVVQELPTNKSNRTRIKNKKADAVEIPSSLNTSRFLSAWEDYQKHRREKRDAMTPTAIKRTLAKMEHWGVDRAVKALEHSIEQSYTGVYEPKTNGNKQSQPQEPVMKYRNR